MGRELAFQLDGLCSSEGKVIPESAGRGSGLWIEGSNHSFFLFFSFFRYLSPSTLHLLIFSTHLLDSSFRIHNSVSPRPSTWTLVVISSFMLTLAFSSQGVTSFSQDATSSFDRPRPRRTSRIRPRLFPISLPVTPAPRRSRPHHSFSRN